VSGRWWWFAGVVVAVVVAWNLIAEGIDRLGGQPSGPPSSSYATTPDGVAAYADLLARRGHQVSRLRTAPADAALDPEATVVMLDPISVSPQDVTALRRFAEAGGRLVAGGPSPGWVDGLLDDPPRWTDEGGTRAQPLAPAAEVLGIRTVRTAGAGSWREPGEGVPALGTGTSALLLVASPGEGRVVLLADVSPLQNHLLDADDNAALGLALAGEPERPMQFVESVHGYGRATGLGAIPTRWRWVLGGLVLAALLFMVARGRRLGPPERRARELPPPRRQYVESLATTFAKTKAAAPAAATPILQRAARERLARQAGLGPRSSQEALARAGEHLGLPENEIGAVLAKDPGESHLLPVARALARLEQRRAVTSRTRGGVW
jgi:hypothetical protein